MQRSGVGFCPDRRLDLARFGRPACLRLRSAVWRRRAAGPSEKTLRPKMPQNLPAVSAARLRSWASDVLLPFWATAGFDSRHGAFVEKFAPDGAPSSEDYTRVRVQARQIFVFSHAPARGLSDHGERKRVWQGTSVAVRVDSGGRRVRTKQ